MLNSHMKSHTAIYQYRCADCNYATKYCHSLKLHLRKYNHKPDMVLNLDGTPNPLPIIDVYGTRRGPKIKKDDSELLAAIAAAPATPNNRRAVAKSKKKPEQTPSNNAGNMISQPSEDQQKSRQGNHDQGAHGRHEVPQVRL